MAEVPSLTKAAAIDLNRAGLFMVLPQSYPECDASAALRGVAHFR
jgi:hypothetical protein